jgi:tripartite ATP-independent transporter DctP family solute receptor
MKLLLYPTGSLSSFRRHFLLHRLFLVVWGCLLLLPCLGGIANALEIRNGVRILRSADVHQDDYPTVQAVQFVSRQIAKASANKLKIEIYPSGLLGDEAPLLKLVRSGKLDMNRVSIQALDSISPLARVLSLPYLFRDTEHLHRVLDGPIGQEILDSLSRQGLVGLAFYDAGIRCIYSASKPIQRLDDMKGLTIRIQPSAMSQLLFESLGAIPVKLPLAQVENAMNNELVSAAENNLLSYDSTGHYRLAPYFSQTRHTMSPDVLVMSKIVWDTLPTNERKIIKQAAKKSVLLMRALWHQREEESEAGLKTKGVAFNEIPESELPRFVEASKAVYLKFANTPEQKNLIQRIRATQ